MFFKSCNFHIITVCDPQHQLPSWESWWPASTLSLWSGVIRPTTLPTKSAPTHSPTPAGWSFITYCPVQQPNCSANDTTKQKRSATQLIGVLYAAHYSLELHGLTLRLKSNDVHFQWLTKNNNVILSVKKGQCAKQPRQLVFFYQIYFLVIQISAALFITFQDANIENILGNQLAAPQVLWHLHLPPIAQILAAWSDPPSPPAPRGILVRCANQCSASIVNVVPNALISIKSA